MTIPGEIADALVSALETPTAQAALVATISAGEVPLEKIIDTTIANVKGQGMLGLVINAAKGTVEAEINAEFSKLSPTVVAAWLTKMAQQEAKALGG